VRALRDAALIGGIVLFWVAIGFTAGEAFGFW